MRAIPCAKLQQLTAASNRSVANLHRAAPPYYKVSAAQNGCEGLQFTQDRLKAGSRDLSETSKSSSVSVNAAGFCACERSAIFVAFRCTSGAGANRNRQGGTGNQGRGRGDKKANGISAANPHPVVKGERRPVGGRAIHQTPPAAANTANRLQGRGVPIAPQKNGNRAPQTCHPSHKAPTQPPGPAANRRMRNK